MELAATSDALPQLSRLSTTSTSSAGLWRRNNGVPRVAANVRPEEAFAAFAVFVGKIAGTRELVIGRAEGAIVVELAADEPLAALARRLSVAKPAVIEAAWRRDLAASSLASDIRTASCPRPVPVRPTMKTNTVAAIRLERQPPTAPERLS